MTADDATRLESSADAAGAPGTISRSHSGWLLAATVLAAVSAFVISAVAVRSLPIERGREFTTFWSLLFGAFSIAGGLQNEATRATTAVAGGAPGKARILTVAAILGGGAGALLLLTSPLWAPATVGTTWPWIAPTMSIAVAMFAMQAGLAGACAGQHAWRGFAGLMALESGLRLLLVGLVAGIGARLGGFELATVGANLAWLVLLLVPEVRRAAGARADVGLGRLLRNSALALISSAAYAVLVVGFPAIFSATARGGSDAEITSVMTAVTLTRAPIMMPLLAFQGVAITAFTARTSHRLRALVTPLAAIGGVGLAGALAAWLLGPWLFLLIYGRDKGLGLPGWVFATLVLAAVALAWLTLTGTAAIASNAHAGYMAGWVVAAAVSVGLVLLPLRPAERAVIALAAGPIVGVIIHLAAIRRADHAPTP